MGLSNTVIASMLNMPIQGVGPFMRRIENDLKRERLDINHYMPKKLVAGGRPVAWTVLTEEQRREALGLTKSE